MTSRLNTSVKNYIAITITISVYLQYDYSRYPVLDNHKKISNLPTAIRVVGLENHTEYTLLAQPNLPTLST